MAKIVRVPKTAGNPEIMAEIIEIGAPWAYKAEVCEGCTYLEKSVEPPGEEPWVACDAPEGKCVKDGRQIYPERQ